MKSITKLSSVLLMPCHIDTRSKLRTKNLFVLVWNFHANQHAYLCNQNFHGTPCHNHQKHGRSRKSIFAQGRLLRSSGAKPLNCESVCPLDLLPSMCICVHILAVEVKTYIFNAFSDISDPFHTEPLPQHPSQGLLLLYSLTLCATSRWEREMLVLFGEASWLQWPALRWFNRRDRQALSGSRGSCVRIRWSYRSTAKTLEYC